MQASTVSEFLLTFMKTAFKNRLKVLKRLQLNRAHETAVFEQIGSGVPLTINEIADMKRGQQKVLYELLSQYIIFFELNRHLPFPPGFLDDSSTEQLGPQLLGYIALYTWPFPQQLPPGSIH